MSRAPTVFVVDDDASTRELLEWLMKREGLEVRPFVPGLYRHLGKLEESRKALESFTRLERETNDLEKMRRDGVATPPGRKRD